MPPTYRIIALANDVYLVFAPVEAQERDKGGVREGPIPD